MWKLPIRVSKEMECRVERTSELSDSKASVDTAGVSGWGVVPSRTVLRTRCLEHGKEATRSPGSCYNLTSGEFSLVLPVKGEGVNWLVDVGILEVVCLANVEECLGPWSEIAGIVEI